MAVLAGVGFPNRVLPHGLPQEVEAHVPFVYPQGVRDLRLLWIQFQSDACEPLLYQCSGLFHAHQGGVQHYKIIGVPYQGWLSFPSRVCLL